MNIISTVLAHAEEELEEHPHEASEVASIDPVIAAAGIGGIALAGFAAWWFLLRKK